MQSEKGSRGPCPALLFSCGDLHKHDVIVFSPVHFFRAEPTACRASHTPFGQKNHALPGWLIDIWSSTHLTRVLLYPLCSTM